MGKFVKASSLLSMIFSCFYKFCIPLKWLHCHTHLDCAPWIQSSETSFFHIKQDLKSYCSHCITDLRTMSAFQVDDTIHPKFKVKPICPVGSRTRRRCRSEKSVCFFEFIDEEFIIFGSSEDKINETCN